MCNFVRGFRRAYKWRANKWRAYKWRAYKWKAYKWMAYKQRAYKCRAFKWRAYKWKAYKWRAIQTQCISVTGFKLTRTEKAQAIAALIKICIALITQTNFNTIRTKKETNNTNKTRT